MNAIHKWQVYLLYSVPGAFLALWLEFLWCHARPLWLVPAQSLVIAAPIITCACICGKKGWKWDWVLGGRLNCISSWVCLALVSSYCVVCKQTWQPGPGLFGFEVQMLMLSFSLGLLMQYSTYSIARKP